MNVDFCRFRNDAVPCCAEIVQLTSFCIYRSMHIINSKYLCACLVCRKVIDLAKPDLPDYTGISFPTHFTHSLTLLNFLLL